MGSARANATERAGGRGAQTPQSALAVAERIRRVVAAARFESGALVIVSIGIDRSRPGDTTEDLLNRADHCMYQAKQNGRNQVVKGSMIDSAA
ncbi:MAG: diguanylate cyclase [Candidatus Pelethousia sp.]|nr:diguanylate cyclase [Candidatus Pelethousia sp.]